MNAQQPGPPTEDYDHSIPLKAVKVYPPATEAASPRTTTYTVRIELSRNGSVFEKKAVEKFFPQGRIYGNTLELLDTTVETIAEGASLVSSQLTALEKEARKAADAENELQRQRDAEAAAEAARYENLTRMAAEVRFD
ncbi:hypothetical protein [Arthrobacter sp. NicSoilB8]|uniref:hypothetical protein n=1 Tax=Arthrobacter sp. NicSoilB8 TaxID=2830998 RepID=UPI001CC34EF4|nr:hypothetical protein [Arthrobacter sp. NicSoilB8]BCW69976.1 hypothetical protein NicSoilB8_10200 [Arthrobacter sp. NicSoilB8]